MEVLEPDFKSDQEGRVIFFPSDIWGLKSVGYIIPNEEKKKEFIKIYKQYTYQFLTIFLIGSYLIQKSLIIMVLIFGAMFLIHYAFSLKIKKMIQNLQVSDMRVTPHNKLKEPSILLILAMVLIGIFSIFGFLKILKL